MTCRCISYNRTHTHQDVPSRVLEIPEWVRSQKYTVCVDDCIAHAVLALWDAKIWTLNSCCGHNGAFRRCIIVDKSDRERAATVLRDIGEAAEVAAWELVYGDTYEGG